MGCLSVLEDYLHNLLNVYIHVDSCIAGHWIADPCEFGQVSFHTMPPQYEQFCKEFDEKSLEQLWQGFGMMASFGWCAAQAHNQGLCKLSSSLSYAANG